MLDSVESGKDEPALYSLSWEQARNNRMTADRFLTDIAKKNVPDALTSSWSLTVLLQLLPSEIENGGRVYSFRLCSTLHRRRHICGFPLCPTLVPSRTEYPKIDPKISVGVEIGYKNN